MTRSSASSRSALGGAAGVMACSCGASSMIAKIVLLAGLGVTAAVVQPALVAIGAAFVIAGLLRIERRSAQIAIAAFAVMAVAAVLAPQHMMSGGDMGNSRVPWSAITMWGGALYLVSIAALGYAFWRAFPSPRPGASGAAIGGMALATGCTCCLVTGSTAGMVTTLGATAALPSTPVLFWIAMAVTAVALFQLGGIRAAIWVPAGAVLVRTGLDWINQAFGHPKIGAIEPLFVLKWALMIGGYSIVMYAFARAYALASERAAAPIVAAPAPASAATM